MLCDDRGTAPQRFIQVQSCASQPTHMPSAPESIPQDL